VLVVEGDEELAVVRLFSKRLRMSNAAIAVTGVGGVFTDPAYRGRGIATKLVEHVLHSHPGPFALYASTAAHLYQRLGFIEVASGLFLYPGATEIQGGHF
jgi:GNAT superfamily N-acetyltransferase